jgi:hypothetical protein
VNGTDKDREIGRDQEGGVKPLEDEQKSAWGAIRQEKNFRLPKPNAIKANECCKDVVEQLGVEMLCMSMNRSDVGFE